MTFIIAEIKNNVGFITLNAEKALNALNLAMVVELKRLLIEWKNNANVTCIFMQGAGEKAFCAGGDVREVRNAIIEQHELDQTQLSPKALSFFVTEYEVDYLIQTYPKPIVIWGSGIVMGGGLGLLAGASHRVVTETSVLAMPEITIGLYPDVGASWFLNKMPSAYGLYLGLTATRFDAADALFLGLADYFCLNNEKETLLKILDEVVWEDNSIAQLSSILNSLQTVPAQTAQTKEHASFISQFEHMQSITDFEKIMQTKLDDDWVRAGYEIFKTGSPSSKYIILKQLQESKNYTLEEVFQSELNLSCQCSLHPDFVEGVRALLVDKDKNPLWTPNDSDKVAKEWLEGYFTPIWTNENHPLKHLGK